jgi:hypothetical protein
MYAPSAYVYITHYKWELPDLNINTYHRPSSDSLTSFRTNFRINFFSSSIFLNFQFM